MHTIYCSRKMTAKRDRMTMAGLQARFLSGVRMKDSSSERRNHVAAMTERSLESHLSMMESYRRKNSLTSAIHADKEKKEKTKPSVFASMRKAITANIVNAVAAVNVSGRSMYRTVSLGRFIGGLMWITITVRQ